MQQQRRQQLWNFRFLYFFFVLLALITSNIIIKSGSAKAVGSKKIGRILHLTDFHVDVNYDTETGLISAFCHSSNKSPGQIADGRPAGKFGDRHCDAPKLLLEYVLSEAKRVVPNPDLIIWTGDNTPHIEYNSTNYVIDTMRLTSDAIHRYFGQTSTTIVPAMGNHDFSPPNYVPDQPNEVYERTFDLWEHWIGAEQRETFRLGGYYKFMWQGQTFLVLNTNIYYIYNHDDLNEPTDPAGQFAFLKRELELAKKNQVKVNIVGHIPPGAFEREFLKVLKKNYNEKMLDLIVEYAPWTNWLIFGHLHTDTFRIVRDLNGDPAQVIFVSAAVSPLQTNNPAFRIYDYDVHSMEIQDIRTYFIDLDKLNTAGANTQMQLEYLFRDAYQMDSLRPTAFANLLERLKKEKGLFEQYIRFNSVQSNLTMPSKAERAYQLCAIEFLDHSGYDNCVDKHTKEEENGTGTARTSVLFFVLGILFTIFISHGI